MALPAQRRIDFARDVEPVFRTKCVACHGAAQQISGLRLDRRDEALKGGYSGPVIRPGASADSKLVHRLLGENGLMAMPPAGPRLTAGEIEAVRTWIDQGAVWPDQAPAEEHRPAGHPHWAFQPIRRPAEPSITNAGPARSPVDRFILSRLEREKIAPSPEAEKRVLLRRLSLDLIGLPPTPDEVAAFVQDPRPDAYDRAIDRLLASPHFGERWARPWLDRARYADSDGYEKDWSRPYAWRYRHWVIDTLNRDMPFDQFTIEQIAGDLLPGAGIEQRVATGFHRNTLTNREGGIDNRQFQFETAVDRANTVATAWLGITMGCAQCHDHKYDPISQRDYYQLYAFFENLDEVYIDAPMPGELGPYLRTRDEYQARREALLAEYRVPELQPEWERRLLEASANPGKWTDWDLAWDCLLKLTEFGDGENILRTPPERRSARERDVLIDHFVRNYHFAVGPTVYEKVKFKELDRKLRELKQSYPQLTQAMAVAEGPAPGPSHLRVRGDYRTLGIEVKPDTPAVLPPLKANGRATRLDLARWIVAPGNPLTARVTVNWVWQELFGRGLVRTPDDFGTRAEKPTHPELLDWLAAEFVEDGWSLKRLIRTIVTSATYRQSSAVRPDLREVDPDNSLLARQSRLRLPAELIRDSALFAAGLLSTEVGGKSVFPPQPAGVAELGYGNRSEAWPESQGADRYRRGLYIHFQRSTPYPMLMNFDAPKASVAACSRERSNSALQALNLLNDPAFMEAAESLAYRALMESEASPAARLNALCLRTLGREPNDREQRRFYAFLEKQRGIFDADPEAAAQLAPSGLPEMSRSEIAAWVSLASVLLNLDEFITRE
ncbi:MAG: PSD1 and planctomycete cytochrome C domain-containing protein [Bryobacteraceae bacterium]